MSRDIDDLTREEKVTIGRRIQQTMEMPRKQLFAWGTLKDYMAPARMGDALIFRGKVYSGWKAFLLFDLPQLLFGFAVLAFFIFGIGEVANVLDAYLAKVKF